MSMHIEFDDDYSSTTFYYGTLELPDKKDSNEYRFQVSVVYLSNKGNYTIDEIIWEGDGPQGLNKYKSEKRITDVVSDWHSQRCHIKIGEE